MIYFACKQCGNRFERPEESVGLVIICECGGFNEVPPTSTMPPPPQRQAPLPVAVARPLSPLSGPQRPAFAALNRPEPLPALGTDPAYCLNHADVPMQSACAVCGLSFCAGCLATLQKRLLCGPCKNFYLRTLQRTPRLAMKALLAPLISLVGGPIVMVVGLIIAGGSSMAPTGIVAGAIVALIPQFIVLVLGFQTLADVESNPKTSGRDLAITGLASALVMTILIICGTLAMLLNRN